VVTEEIVFDFNENLQKEEDSGSEYVLPTESNAAISKKEGKQKIFFLLKNNITISSAHQSDDAVSRKVYA
jgi:hypothetical protein